MKNIVALFVVFGLAGRISGQWDYNPCSFMPEDGVLNFGNEYDCTRFTMCIGTTPHERTCSPGMHFSNAIGQCDLIERAQCTPIGGNPPVSPPTNDGVCSIDINYEVIADQLNCDTFTVCACGHAHSESCAAGLIFDSRTQQCNVAGTAVCLSNPANVPACTSVGNVGHPHDCKHYYFCQSVGSAAVLRRCAPGLRFNRSLNQCDQVSCSLPTTTRFQSILSMISESVEVSSE